MDTQARLDQIVEGRRITVPNGVGPTRSKTRLNAGKPTTDKACVQYIGVNVSEPCYHLTYTSSDEEEPWYHVRREAWHWLPVVRRWWQSVVADMQVDRDGSTLALKGRSVCGQGRGMQMQESALAMDKRSPWQGLPE